MARHPIHHTRSYRAVAAPSRSFATALLTLLTALLLAAANTSAKHDQDKTIYWPYFSFPPYFILEDGKPASGAGIALQNLLMRKMPEYEHVLLEAPPERMFQDISNGRQYAIIGPVKTPEREKNMLFTIACRVAFMDQVVIRAADLPKFGQNPVVSLRTLLEDESLTFGHQRSVSYGPEVDRILAEYAGSTNIHLATGSQAYERLMLMLADGRLDYILAEPPAVAHVSDKHALGDSLYILDLKEQETKALPAYIALPDTPWGLQVREIINGLLREAIDTGELYKTQLQYIPESYRPRYDQLYEKLIARPAREE